MESFFIIAALASFLVGTSKGGLPALALLAVPILALVMPVPLAAGLLLPLYIISDMYGLALYRKLFSAFNLRVMLPAALAGVVFGFLSVNAVSDAWTRIMLACIGFFYLAREMQKPVHTPQPSRLLGNFWGFWAGFTSYISHAGGSPFQVYVLPQRLEKRIFAGTTTIFFAIVNLAKLPFYIVAGQIAMEATWTYLGLVPFALFGVWSGFHLVRVLPERGFYIIVKATLLVVSVVLMFDGVRDLMG